MNLRLTPRLYCTEDLAQGNVVSVGTEQSHYLRNVMRLKTGDMVRLFNERDGEWSGALGAVGKRSLQVEVRERQRAPKPEPDLWLCCAPIKKAHFDTMIEKATELGVAVIQPILTGRTQIREVNTARARVMAIEAAEQSERMSIPDIRSPLRLEDLFGAWPADRNLVVCAEFGKALPAHEAMTTLRPCPGAAIVTGPEGGFLPEELEFLRNVSEAVFVRLGPRILRADTAAIAALALWQGLCGDWTSA